MSELEFTGDDAKLKLLNKTELDEVDRAFDLNSLRVLESRYLLRDEQGKIIESPKQLFTRIAILIGLGDAMHDESIFSMTPRASTEYVLDQVFIDGVLEHLPEIKIGEFTLNQYHKQAVARLHQIYAKKGQMYWDLETTFYMLGINYQYAQEIKEYYHLMVSKTFLPNTPTLMNAGAKLGQLSACFVLGIEDNLESIMQTAKDVAFIFKSGGGVGINYSHLRAENSMVASTSGVASGPISFMGIIDKVTDVIKQGGKRRGANMGILNINHSDVEKFITAKRKKGVLENFNISVGTDAEFWNDFETGESRAERLFDLIAESAHASAEPGLIFFERVNQFNPLLKARGFPLEATNPCGEQSLYPFESCNLGSINLANFVNEDGEFEWSRYHVTIRECTQFLDNVVSMNKYPLPEIEQAGLETRRIGLGVMGLSDALIKMGVRYDSPVGFELMSRMAEDLTYYAMDESVKLAIERGSFPLFKESGYVDGLIPVAGAYQFSELGSYNDWKALIENIKDFGIRNSYCTTVAPTGSLSMIADTSSGIEPTFALAFEKRVAVGRYFYKNKYLKEWLAKNGKDIDEVWKNIASNHGSAQNTDIDATTKAVFVTTFDIKPAEHIQAQAVWQKWINNAISKTINLPKEATVDDVKNAYLLAHESGLKGITIYRDGSRHEQVLHA
jgi:ribonucleoside-diphosphate reductase alpha chain